MKNEKIQTIVCYVHKQNRQWLFSLTLPEKWKKKTTLKTYIN